MFTLQALFGIAAGVLSFAAYPVYILDIFRGKTKPSKTTWWILALLNMALAASYYASGARDTIWIPVSYSIGFLTIAFLSLRYGAGSWGRMDIVCLVGAVVSIALWFLLGSAEIALYLIILTDLLGLAPTIYKAYKEPATESRASWTIATIASALNIAAVESWTFAIYLYPVYVLVTNGLILSFILRKS